MLSHAPPQSPAASCKPRPPSPRSCLGSKTAACSTSRSRDVSVAATSRRGLFLLVPSLAAASAVLHLLPFAFAADADDAAAPTPPPPPDVSPSPAPADAEAEEPEDSSAMSRIYDASVLGEPEAVTGKEAKRRVWEKLAAARVVYLGEAEVAPDPDDRALELEIVKGLQARCADAGRGLALALEAFPCDLQQQLDQFMDGRIDGRILKLYTSHWPPKLWQEYEPLLNYCCESGIKLIACGAPLEVRRTVLAEGIKGLSKAE